MILDDAIAVKKARLDALRPVKAVDLRALDIWYDVELTYSSNALEGNSLTRSETDLILEKGITVGGKPLKDHLEAIDHRDALAFVRALAATSEPIREGDVRELHRLVLGRSHPEEAGRYSPRARVILGSKLTLPSPAEIAPSMADFAAWLRAVSAEPETAFEAHYRLVTIHPFGDGNGRTERLLMNLILLKGGYPPVAIEPESRLVYVDALAARQVARDPAPYARFMREALLASLDRTLDHIAPETGYGAPRV